MTYILLLFLPVEICVIEGLRIYFCNRMWVVYKSTFK